MRDGEPITTTSASKEPLPPDPAAERLNEISRLVAEEERLQAEIARARVVKLQAEDRLHQLGRMLRENRLLLAQYVDQR